MQLEHGILSGSLGTTRIRGASQHTFNEHIKDITLPTLNTKYLT